MSETKVVTEFDIWGINEGGPNKGEWSQWTVVPFASLAEAHDFIRRYWPTSVCDVRPHEGSRHP